jgi:hypothetical protein
VVLPHPHRPRRPGFDGLHHRRGERHRGPAHALDLPGGGAHPQALRGGFEADEPVARGRDGREAEAAVGLCDACHPAAVEHVEAAVGAAGEAFEHVAGAARDGGEGRADEHGHAVVGGHPDVALAVGVQVAHGHDGHVGHGRGALLARPHDEQSLVRGAEPPDAVGPDGKGLDAAEGHRERAGVAAISGAREGVHAVAVAHEQAFAVEAKERHVGEGPGRQAGQRYQPVAGGVVAVEVAALGGHDEVRPEAGHLETVLERLGAVVARKAERADAPVGVQARHGVAAANPERAVVVLEGLLGVAQRGHAGGERAHGERVVAGRHLIDPFVGHHDELSAPPLDDALDVAGGQIRQVVADEPVPVGPHEARVGGHPHQSAPRREHALDQVGGQALFGGVRDLPGRRALRRDGACQHAHQHQHRPSGQTPAPEGRRRPSRRGACGRETSAPDRQPGGARRQHRRGQEGEGAVQTVGAAPRFWRGA